MAKHQVKSVESLPMMTEHSGPEGKVEGSDSNADVAIALVEPHEGERLLLEGEPSMNEAAADFEGYCINFNEHSTEGTDILPDRDDPRISDGDTSTTAVIAQHVHANKLKEYPTFLRDVHAAAKKFPGIQRIEVIPPKPGLQQSYISLVKFDTHEHVVQWLESPERQSLVERGEREFWVSSPNVQLVRTGTQERVTTIVSGYVKPEKEKDCIRWHKELIAVLKKQPGFVDCEILTPKCTGVPGKWTLVIRFASPSALNGWLQSSVRTEVLKRGEGIATDVDVAHVASSFDGFFNFGVAAQDVRRVPPRSKQSLVVMVALIAVLLLWNEILIPHISHWNPSLLTVFVAFLNMLVLAGVLLPLLSYLLKPWLLSDGFFKWGMSSGGGEGYEYIQADATSAGEP